MMNSQSTTVLSHLLAVLSLHVHEVGGVQAAVHALLVPGDSTLHGDAAWSRAEDELLQIGHVDQRAVWRGGPWGHDLLGRGTHGHLSHSAGIGGYVVCILRLVGDSLKRLCRWQQTRAWWSRHEATGNVSALPPCPPRFHWIHRSSCCHRGLVRKRRQIESIHCFPAVMFIHSRQKKDN